MEESLSGHAVPMWADRPNSSLPISRPRLIKGGFSVSWWLLGLLTSPAVTNKMASASSAVTTIFDPVLNVVSSVTAPSCPTPAVSTDATTNSGLPANTDFVHCPRTYNTTYQGQTRAGESVSVNQICFDDGSCICQEPVLSGGGGGGSYECGDCTICPFPAQSDFPFEFLCIPASTTSGIGNSTNSSSMVDDRTFGGCLQPESITSAQLSCKVKGCTQVDTCPAADCSMVAAVAQSASESLTLTYHCEQNDWLADPNLRACTCQESLLTPSSTSTDSSDWTCSCQACPQPLSSVQVQNNFPFGVVCQHNTNGTLRYLGNSCPSYPLTLLTPAVSLTSSSGQLNCTQTSSCADPLDCAFGCTWTGGVEGSNGTTVTINYGCVPEKQICQCTCSVGRNSKTEAPCNCYLEESCLSDYGQPQQLTMDLQGSFPFRLEINGSISAEESLDLVVRGSCRQLDSSSSSSPAVGAPSPTSVSRPPVALSPPTPPGPPSSQLVPTNTPQLVPTNTPPSLNNQGSSGAVAHWRNPAWFPKWLNVAITIAALVYMM